MSEMDKAIQRTLEQGGVLLVAFFRDQGTVETVISQLPYVELDLPYVTVRAGTTCQSIGNVTGKDGSKGFALVTGGKLEPNEIKIAVRLFVRYGEEQMFSGPDIQKYMPT